MCYLHFELFCVIQTNLLCLFLTDWAAKAVRTRGTTTSWSEMEHRASVWLMFWHQSLWNFATFFTIIRAQKACICRSFSKKLQLKKYSVSTKFCRRTDGATRMSGFTTEARLIRKLFYCGVSVLVTRCWCWRARFEEKGKSGVSLPRCILVLSVLNRKGTLLPVKGGGGGPVLFHTSWLHGPRGLDWCFYK